MTRWTRTSSRPGRRRASPLARWIAGALVVACALGFAQDATGSAEPVERGRALYLEHHCGACHALAATGSQGFFGPAHDAVAVIAAARIADPDYRGDAETAAEYLRESIVAPGAYMVPGYAFTRHSMPAYDLPEADLDALVAYLMEQDGTGGTSP